MLFLTTTAIDIDEELLNRCLVLTVNESREQTEAIHHAQRQKRTLKGLESKIEKSFVLQLHRNAQRLLKPLTVINPYADQLTFLADKTRTRRDHEKYLTLIDSIALLHQYQRDIKTLGALEYIEVTTADIALANRLAHEVLGKTLDELPPQTRQLLSLINSHASTECKTQNIEQRGFRFSRRCVRALCGWSETQVRVHMQRLVTMEYLLTHRGSRGQSFEYELLYSGEGENGNTFLMGLLDVEHLTDNKNNTSATAPCVALPPASCSRAMETSRSNVNSSRNQVAESAVSTRPQRGRVADYANEVQPSNCVALHELQNDWVESAYVAV